MWRKFWPHTLSATLPIRLCYETFFVQRLSTVLQSHRPGEHYS